MLDIRRPRLGALVLFAGLTLAGCDDATGPSGPFDARSTADALEAMMAASPDMADAFASLDAAEPLFAGTGTAALVPSSGSSLALDAGALRSFGQGLTGTAFFPSDLLGVTFGWDEGLGSYVPTHAAGAPADGIRVLYYAVDPITHTPASPLNALGYIDLRDLGTASSDRLGITVVSTSGASDVTLADYYIDVSTSIQTGLGVDVSSVGYLSNGTDRLNFDLYQGVLFTETLVSLTQDFAMALDGTGVSVSWQSVLSGDPQAETGSLEVTAAISDGTDTAVLELSGTEAMLVGSILWGGTPVVSISGTMDHPVFTGSDGEPLDAAELQALQDMWQAFEALFALVDGIFGPGGA